MQSVCILLATLLVIAQSAHTDDQGSASGSHKNWQAQERKADALPQVLIRNVNVFDGTSDKLAMGLDVLVDGNPIEDLLLLTDKDNIPVIIKNGKVFKNAL